MAYHSSSELEYYENRSKQLKKNDFSVTIRHLDNSSSDANMIKWHWHEEIEIILFQQGQACITCEDEDIITDAGDIVFINQSRKHFISPLNEDGYISDHVIVQPIFILGFGQLELERKYFTPLLQDTTVKMIHIAKGSHPHYDLYANYLLAIISLNMQKQMGFELLIKSNLLQLWTLLFSDTCQKNRKVTKNLTVQDEQRVKQAIIYIQEHYMESISLEDIATSILVSKSECCRCFKRVLNTTPFEYLMKYRIIESTKRMHRKTSETIAEIAGSVGFNNISYYNKIFKKFMNCTPTEYRKNIVNEK